MIADGVLLAEVMYGARNFYHALYEFAAELIGRKHSKTKWLGRWFGWAHIFAEIVQYKISWLM